MIQMATDADWLRLREPLDEAARALELTWAFGRALPTRPQLLDLGAGLGAGVRYLAQRIGRAEQDWVLIEKDMKLLSKAPGEFVRWAQRSGHSVTEERRALTMRSDELALRVEMRSYDLARDLAGLSFGMQDGITASGLLHLTSAEWLARFAQELTGCGFPPVLLAMMADGRVEFGQVDADDGWVMERVAARARRDHGFGPALGGDAPRAAVEALGGAGYRVETARADWRLGPRQKATHRAILTELAARAVAEDPAAGERIAAWAERRRGLADAGCGLMLGHTDLLAHR